ncbi:MAG: GNAT family N-acetyltransferase [Myxococcales bacterium]|nr:GNAT family N-acetyltransferase [Myxococcales bacterium]
MSTAAQPEEPRAKIRFEYRPMTAAPSDLDRFRDCFARNGSPRSEAKVLWQYANNPTGKLYVDFAIDPARPDEIAGIYAVQPCFVRVGAEVRLGVQSVDTLVDERYRGQGLFVKMARAVYDRCARDGCALVYGFPNGNSAHGFFTKLDWKPLDPVPFLVRPLRSRYVTDRLFKGRAWAGALPNVPVPVIALAKGRAKIAPLERFDERTDRVWRDFSRSITLSVERDAKYLEWRLRQHWSGAYERLAYYDGDDVLGFVATAVFDKHGGRVAYVMELVYQPWRPDVGRALLAEALRRCAQQGADVALAWCLPHSPNRDAYTSQLFAPLPQRLWPLELHAGARSFDLPSWVAHGDRRSWYLSYCDSDTV